MKTMLGTDELHDEIDSLKKRVKHLEQSNKDNLLIMTVLVYELMDREITIGADELVRASMLKLGILNVKHGVRLWIM